MGQRRMWPILRDLLSKFWDPRNISGMSEYIKLKFSTQIDRKSNKK